MIRLTIITTLLFLITGCNFDSEKKFNKDKTFPDVKDLNDYYKETSFIPTLESDFDYNHNAIYAASLLMAWDELKNGLSEPIKSIESLQLTMINNSDSYQNVLSDKEFISEVEIYDTIIIAKAYFKKSLPFEIPLKRDDYPLNFYGDSVVSFGFYGYNNTANIAYYNDDNDFALRLLPANKEHEIILLKTEFEQNTNLKIVIENMTEEISDFRDRKNEKNFWRYYLNDEDRVRIPIIEFNIATNYDNIIGTYITTESRKLLMEAAFQQTAFVLDEKGAEVESYAEFATEELEEELPKPKKLYFDKSYVIMLKRKDNKFPYFAMYVTNSELMIKK